MRFAAAPPKFLWPMKFFPLFCPHGRFAHPRPSLALRRGPRGIRVALLENGGERWSEDFSDAVARLRVDVEAGGRCRFSFGRRGKELVRLRVGFQAVVGVWIGAKVGLYCIATTASASDPGHADFGGVRFGAGCAST